MSIERVKHVTGSTGTGDVYLGTVPDGYFSAIDEVGDGNTATFFLKEGTGNGWEMFEGTVDASASTVSRDITLGSSVSGSSIDLSKGQHTLQGLDAGAANSLASLKTSVLGSLDIITITGTSHNVSVFNFGTLHKTTDDGNSSVDISLPSEGASDGDKAEFLQAGTTPIKFSHSGLGSINNVAGHNGSSGQFALITAIADSGDWIISGDTATVA